MDIATGIIVELAADAPRARPGARRSDRSRARTRQLAASAISHLLIGIAVITVAIAGAGRASSRDLPEPSMDRPGASQSATATSTPTTAQPAVETVAEAAMPDAVADYVGGVAARLRTSDGTPVSGDIFFLAATPGSDAAARLFDQTPYRHDREVAAEALASNFAAVETVEAISGLDVRFLDFTTAPGGGSSGGLTYTIAYLNVVSNGAFTGDLRIAATGRIAPKGYVRPISAINEKTAAAHLAGADVLFTPSTPTNTHLERYSTRYVVEHNRVGLTAMTLGERRQLDHYHGWGASRADGLDIVGVRHIADVAAYLCGARSPYACTIADHLAETSTGVGSTYDTPSYRDSYWNSYTNEWVPYDTPSYRDGYWNSYINEWVPYDTPATGTVTTTNEPFFEHAAAAWGLA